MGGSLRAVQLILKRRVRVQGLNRLGVLVGGSDGPDPEKTRRGHNEGLPWDAGPDQYERRHQGR